MALAYSTALRNAQLDAITTAAGANATIKIYAGTRPATGGTATTLLGTLTCGSTFAPAAALGVLTLNAITGDTSADATGTAAWFRLATSGGTFVMDGNVAASASDLNVNTISFVAGADIEITSFVITRGNP